MPLAYLAGRVRRTHHGANKRRYSDTLFHNTGVSGVFAGVSLGVRNIGMPLFHACLLAYVRQYEGELRSHVPLCAHRHTQKMHALLDPRHPQRASFKFYPLRKIKNNIFQHFENATLYASSPPIDLRVSLA